MPDGSTAVALYDVYNNANTPRLKSVLIDSMSARFMREIEYGLQQQSRHHVRLLNLVSIVEKHEKVMSNLSPIVLAGIADLSPLRGRALVAVDGDLLGAIVDAMCGATEAFPFERSELSHMEQKMGRRVLGLVDEQVSKAFEPLVKLRLTPSAYETGTGLLAIADSQDWMIKVEGLFETDTGKGRITIVIPLSSFDAIEQRVASQSGLIGGRNMDDEWSNGLENRCESIPLRLEVIIARAILPASLVNNLKVGMEVPFVVERDAVVCTQGIDLFLATFGTHNGYYACKPLPGRVIVGDNMSTSDDDLSAGIASDRIELERLQHMPERTLVLGASNVLDRVKVHISASLGSTNMPVQQIRALRQGEVILLDQQPGDPIALSANGEIIAYGEAVKIDGQKIGIRIVSLAEDKGRKPADAI